MQNPDLIRKRFSRQFGRYNTAASVQKQMAADLIDVLRPLFLADVADVFEIGCGTGFVTDLLAQNLPVRKYMGNDLIAEAAQTVSRVFNGRGVDFDFIQHDASKLDRLPFSPNLIISGASLQWISDLEAFFKKMHGFLSEGGSFAFSSFAPGNFKEIETTTGFSLQYFATDTVCQMLEPYFTVEHCDERTVTLYFDDTMALLRHIKDTGVNGLNTARWTKGRLQKFEESYNSAFRSDKGVPLSYQPQIFIAKKK